MLEPKGIYSSEILICNCKKKHYLGGKKVLLVSEKCTNIPRHDKNKLEFICPSCEKEFENYKKLKEHKWTHAI